MIVTPGQLSKRANFYHQLASLITAGVPITNALEQLKRHPPAHSYRKPLELSLMELAGGKTLSESLHSANWLPDFDLTLIQAGEHSGRLDQCFRALFDYYNQRAILAKQMILQISYPLFLIHFAALVFMVVLPYAFSGFSKSLPMLFGKAALALSPIYIATVVILFINQARHGEKWRALLENILNFVPLLGAARRSLALARLTLTLEALISAGVDVISAWKLAVVASNSSRLQRAVADWKSHFENGRTPADLVNNTSVFPETFANLYQSGEIAGKLDETLKRLHSFYQEDAAHKFQVIAQWMPKIVYLIVALGIAYAIIQAWGHMYGPNSNLAHIINGQ